MSNRQNKIEINKAEQQDFLRGKERNAIEKRWEEAQIKAATMQSVLDYMVEQYEAHKTELSEEIVNQTENQINLRRSEIKDFLMSEKEVFIQTLEEYNNTVTKIN
jgi:hypothetical protein